MTKNDSDLGYVREQLALAEGALPSLRNDVLPKNPERYRLMAESYVETILGLRADIDQYLGIDKIAQELRRTA